MLIPADNRFRISQLPFSLSLANRVNTGISMDTPSHAVATTKYWAAKGMQGLGQSGLGQGLGQGLLPSLGISTGGALLGVLGTLIFISFFSTGGKQRRGKRLLKREADRHVTRIAAIERRYGVKE